MGDVSARDLGILRAGDFHGYGHQPLPSGRDAIVGRVVAAIDTAEDFVGIVEALKPARAFVFTAFAERAAALAVRRKSRDEIRKGLVAVALAYALTDDWRDVLGSLAVLLRAAEILALDSVGEVTAVAHTLTGAATKWGNGPDDWLLSFAHRREEDRSVTAFGYVESNDDDGFRFERTW
jgi:hypothetical protein